MVLAVPSIGNITSGPEAAIDLVYQNEGASISAGGAIYYHAHPYYDGTAINSNGGTQFYGLECDTQFAYCMDIEGPTILNGFIVYFNLAVGYPFPPPVFGGASAPV